MRVVSDLVCTHRSPGLRSASLRVLEDLKGKLFVATDPVGVDTGNWVFTTSGTGARVAMSDKETFTDLSICGIIDNWEG